MKNNEKAQLVLYASFITCLDGKSFIRIVTNSQRNRDRNNTIWIGWDAKNKEQDISRTGNPKGELLSLLAKFPEHPTIHLEFNEKEWLHCNNPCNKKEEQFLDHHYPFSEQPEAMCYVHTLLALAI